MTFFFPISLVLYAASCALFLAQIIAGPGLSARALPVGDAAEVSGPFAILPRAARVVLAGALLFHTLDIGIHCAHGLHPVVNVREALSFIAWLMVAVYLATTLRFELPLAGALIVPVTLVLQMAARLGPEPELPGRAVTLLAAGHIVLATAGIAAFAVGAGDSIVYLIAERRIKRRRPLLPGVPSLQKLDELNLRSIQLGFPLFTIAMVTGAVWLMRLPSGGMQRLLQPQYAMSVVAWALYAALLVARLVAGWRGRRAALVTLGGFAASLAVLVIYYVRGFYGGA